MTLKSKSALTKSPGPLTSRWFRLVQDIRPHQPLAVKWDPLSVWQMHRLLASLLRFQNRLDAVTGTGLALERS
jgi:hypothetical protein